MNDQLRQWREDQKHLPVLMRDFHNCKELFKTISEYIVCEDGNPANKVNWVQAHSYTIDVFLWFMAEHGYTLQKCRAKQDFSNLPERMAQHRSVRLERLGQIVRHDTLSRGATKLDISTEDNQP